MFLIISLFTRENDLINNDKFIYYSLKKNVYTLYSSFTVNNTANYIYQKIGCYVRYFRKYSAHI